MVVGLLAAGCSLLAKGRFSRPGLWLLIPRKIPLQLNKSVSNVRYRTDKELFKNAQ
jgi:hypothetical protein